MVPPVVALGVWIETNSSSEMFSTNATTRIPSMLAAAGVQIRRALPIDISSCWAKSLLKTSWYSLSVWEYSPRRVSLPAPPKGRSYSALRVNLVPGERSRSLPLSCCLQPRPVASQLSPMCGLSGSVDRKSLNSALSKEIELSMRKRSVASHSNSASKPYVLASEAFSTTEALLMNKRAW